MMMRLFLFASLLVLTACAPQSAEDYQTGDTSAQITALLNERQYQTAVFLLENRVGKEPTGKDAYLLAEAYLGKAGVEPLSFAARIFQADPNTPEAKLLFPQCPSGALSKPDGVPILCILKRVYLHGPKATDPDFARARELLRRAYPDPTATPQWANAMIGLVETLSLVNRVGDVYVFAKEQDPSALVMAGQQNLPWLREEGKASREEARQAIARAKNSGKTISGLISSTGADVWFQQVDGTIDYSQAIGLPAFLDFVRDHVLKPSDEIQYGDMLDRLRDLVTKQENSLRDDPDHE